MLKSTALYITVGLVALAAGGGVAWWRGADHAATAIASAQAAEANVPGLWDSSFKDRTGTIIDLKRFRGKPLVVNFWATWCEPCKEEIPEFEATSKSVAGQANFVGIAIDNANSVNTFTQKVNVSYPILIGEQDALELAKKEGDRIGVLPFTVIYDENGKKVLAQVGRLTRDKLNAALAPLLAKKS